MSCGATEGIGAIPSACGFQCGAKPPPERFLIADRVAIASRAQIGSQVLVDFSGIPQKDSAGRHAVLVGIYLEGIISLTVPGATNNVVPGYDMLAVWSNIFLEDVSGWQYFAGNLDGRHMWDDRFCRNLKAGPTGGSAGRGSSLPTDLAVNAGAATYTRQIDLYLQLSRHQNDEGPMVEGSIPLVGLTARGAGAFRFTVGSPTGAAPYTGVTFDGFQASSTYVRVWADVMYLDALAIENGWQLESYALTDMSGSLRHTDRAHEYIALRHMPEETGGQNLADYDGITVQANGDTLVPAYTLGESNIRNNVFVQGYDDARQDALYVRTAGQTTILMLFPVVRDGVRMPAGVAQYNFTTRSTHTSSRFLHRTKACQQQARAEMILRLAQCAAGSQVVGINSAGCACEMNPMRPIAIVPPSVPVRAPNGFVLPNVSLVRG